MVQPSGFFLSNGKDRNARPLRFLNGQFDLKVSGIDTGGAWCAFDTIRTKPGGPPRHIHAAQDEWFFVLEGRFRFEVGGETYDGGAGDSVFGPAVSRMPFAASLRRHG